MNLEDPAYFKEDKKLMMYIRNAPKYNDLNIQDWDTREFPENVSLLSF